MRVESEVAILQGQSAAITRGAISDDEIFAEGEAGAVFADTDKGAAIYTLSGVAGDGAT